MMKTQKIAARCAFQVFVIVVVVVGTTGDTSSRGADDALASVVYDGRKLLAASKVCDTGTRCVVRPPSVPPSEASSSHVPCGHGLTEPVGPGMLLDKVPANCSRSVHDHFMHDYYMHA